MNCMLAAGTKYTTGRRIDRTWYISFNENFINMNLDKILQRIRILFSERYIYKKTELITSGLLVPREDVVDDFGPVNTR